jgi:Bacterial PH domain
VTQPAATPEYDSEPVPGLPELLPAAERMLWQGAPSWRDLAVTAFHVRKVLFYFGALAGFAALFRFADGHSLASAFEPMVWLMPLGFIAAALLTLLAWFSARGTVYTITDKRVVMRFGMAIPMAVNLPFKMIDAATLKLNANGSGDIPLALHPGNKLAYPVLWPHARPFRFSRPEPSLRAIPDADRVAGLLASALAGASVQPLAPTGAASDAAAFGAQTAAA